jgi:hypothetical protein
MASQELYEWIDAYLSNRLPEEERIRFEERLKTDPEFAEEVRLQFNAELAARRFAEAEKKDKLANRFKQLEQGKNWQDPRTWIQAAAVILLMLAVPVIVYLTRPNPITLEGLLTGYLAEEPPATFYRGGPEAKAWDNAVSNYYNTHDFEGFVRVSEGLLSDSSFSFRDEALLLTGYSYLRLGKSQTGLEKLSIVDPASSYSEQAKWFTLLANLMIGDLPEARSLAEQITITQGHYKQKNAQNILQRLNKDKE